MRIVYIGCVESSKVFLEAVFSVPEAEVVGIVTKRESNFNSDFVSLESLAIDRKIPCFIHNKETIDGLVSWVRDLHADIIYCFGWSYLISDELIASVALGAIGYHPALLPMNRGRHPIVWALALGLKQTGSSFFFLDSTADSGDLISQEVVAIADDDTAATLYAKLMKIGVKQVIRFTKALAEGKNDRIPQESSKANIWRKRSYKDGLIDWRMSARSIYNLVRALTHPYVGAGFIFNNQEVKVWQAEVVTDFDECENFEPGKILSEGNKGTVVKCGQGSVLLVGLQLSKVARGEYLL